MTEVADPEAQSGVSLLARTEAWLLENGQPEAGAGVIVASDALDLELALCTDSWQALAPAALDRLHRLRKKVEVTRKLFRFYRPDLSQAAGEARLSGSGVQRVCVLFVKAALVRRDPRFLNSALKMVDGVLGQGDLAMSPPVRALVWAALDDLVPCAGTTR